MHAAKVAHALQKQASAFTLGTRGDSHSRRAAYSAHNRGGRARQVWQPSHAVRVTSL
jgi:hypothetical protein